MRRASDLLGRPVADAQAVPLGTVTEVLVDFARGRLGALLVDGKNLGESGLISAEDLEFGDEVLTAREEAVISGEAAVIYRQGKITLEGARNLAVVNHTGRRLGKVADLVLDGARLVALELSEGLLQDVFEGRSTLPMPVEADLAREELVVPADSPALTTGRPSRGINGG